MVCSAPAQLAPDAGLPKQGQDVPEPGSQCPNSTFLTIIKAKEKSWTEAIPQGVDVANLALTPECVRTTGGRCLHLHHGP